MSGRTYKCKGVSEFEKLFKGHMKAREKRIAAAVLTTARVGVRIVRFNQPVAFKELSDSTHARRVGERGASVIVDAPHAAAVENGSRPHWVPLEALVKWVKLRGMQGLHPRRKWLGTTTETHARSVAAQLASLEHRGPAAYSDVDAPLRIAKAIQVAIAKHGTKPHWYALKSLPAIEQALDLEIRTALPDTE